MAAKEKINEWILEYMLQDTWEEFKQSKYLPSHYMDIASGLLQRQYRSTAKVNEMCTFLLVLCRLSDGNNPLLRYENEASGDSEQVTPLEDVLIHLSSLINMQNEEMAAQAITVTNIIKHEAVLVCINAGEKELAKQVFQRQFSNVDKANKKHYEQVSNLKKLVMSKSDKKTAHATHTMYNDFVGLIINYLHQIYEHFNDPFLIMCADNHTNLTACTSNKKEKKRSEHSHKGQKGKKSGFKRDTLDKCKLSLKKLDVSNGSPVSSAETNGESSQTTRHKLKRLYAENDEPFGGTLDKENVAKVRKKTPTKTTEADHVGNVQSDIVTTEADHVGNVQSDIVTSLSPNSTAQHKQPSNSTAQHKQPSVFKSPKSAGQPMAGTSKSRDTDDRPTYQYKKNVGRSDRHKQGLPSTGNNVSDINDLDFDNMSVFSISATVRKKWTREETEEFFDAVIVCGVGNWSQIKDYLDSTRTGVMLKDKWRNMVKSGEADTLHKQRENRKKKT